MQEQTKLEYLISGNFDAKYGRDILRSRYSPVGNSIKGEYIIVNIHMCV